MNTLSNIDLLSVGFAVAANLILGFIVFFRETRSATNILFLIQTIILSFWSSANYLSYQINDLDLSLLLVRLVMFFAVPNSVVFLILMHTFPEPQIRMNKKNLLGLLAITVLTMGISLSPFLFSGIEQIAGSAPKPIIAPGMILFVAVAILSIPAGIFFLIKRFRASTGVQRLQFRDILFGVILMFSLIIIFNFALPSFFGNSRFIPLSAIFTLPFIGLTAYAIFKHHLLNIKVVATEILTFLLTLAAFVEIIFAKTFVEIILRSGVFALLLGIGVMLIRSVRREVEQREKLEVLTRELSTANEKLKELDVQKSQFLSFASHDLKSPINIIKQFATLIADGTYKEPAKIAETIQKIKTTADRATHLVDDFLDIRKIEEGHMDYAFEAKDVVSFVKGITEDYAPVARAEKNIEVSFESKVASANVKMDTTRLRQVFQNLLSNSLKYTEAGWIKVLVTEEQKSILISVKDSGLGMDKQLLPILFEQFRRDPTVAKKIQGTGLGLYISKQIVIAHGGEVWAESEGKGFGSTFFVRLPKAG